MTILTVEHNTVYRYRRPVGFGEHRLMFRPRDSHDMRLLDTGLAIEPPAEVHWLHDVFNNSIAIARFDGEHECLRFQSTITIDHFGIENPDFSLAPYARTYPFAYEAAEMPDLERAVEPHTADPDGRVGQWARRFLADAETTGTQDLLVAMTRAIRDEFAYIWRTQPGVQTPVETLEIGSGTCRDFALLMMEAARCLGLAAQFVSGYLYDPALYGSAPQPDLQLRGTGATHAWVQIYLPGAGWVEFDPTNGGVGGKNLIRVAVARDPSQAIPVQGTYRGDPADFLAMEVEVTVSAGR